MIVTKYPIIATYTLTHSELAMAATVGCMRQISAAKKGRRPSPAMVPGTEWQKHVDGAIGELVLAKHLNVFWDGPVDTFKEGGDVMGYEVRTRSNHDHQLIVRHNDNPDAIFWLVTGLAPTYCVRGWILARDGMKDAFLKTYDERPVEWFVPNSQLITNRNPD